MTHLSYIITTDPDKLKPILVYSKRSQIWKVAQAAGHCKYCHKERHGITAFHHRQSHFPLWAGLGV